jgi:hypothetical protein
VSASVPASRRPVAVTIAVVLIYLGGVMAAGVGILVLLSRYDVAADAVLPVSLLGAGIILFGLLTLAVGGGVGRGSRGARAAVSAYLAALLSLLVVTVVATDSVDPIAVGQIAVAALIVGALWLPPGAAYFAAADVGAPAPA